LEYRKKGTLQELPISKSTYSSWSTIINKHLKNSTFSKMMVDKVTISHAQNFFDSLHQTPAQANRAFTFLKLAFEYCSTRGYRPMNSNVWLYIKKYRENPKRTRINSSEEFGAFIRYLILAERGDIRDKRGDRISLSWVYLRWLELYTGARGDELRTLTIEEINFEERVITKERHKTARITGQDKEIVLNDEAIDVLRRAIDNIDRPYHNRYVLVGKGGNSHIARDSRRQWTNMVEYIRQDIPEFEATPYSLRREFIKRGKMANNNDSSMVQEIVGHKSIVTTELYATDKEVIKINRMKRSKDSQKISSLISREVDRIKGTL
jgi:integrase